MAFWALNHTAVTKSQLQTADHPLAQAQEAFITAAGFFVLPVIQIDNDILGDGKPGSVSTKLRSIYIDMALQQV